MPNVNFDFNDFYVRVNDITTKITKCEMLISIAKDNGAITTSFLQELTELGFTEEREMIEDVTHKEILKILFTIRENLITQYNNINKESEKYKRNILIN